MITLYADFNDHEGHRLRLRCNGTKADLERQAIRLQEGLEMRVSDGELAAQGKIHWAAEHQEWVIDLDPATYEEL